MRITERAEDKKAAGEADRRTWIVSNIAAEARAHVEDQDGLGEERRARAFTFISAGYALDLLSESEARRLKALLLTGETEDRAFLRCLDRIQ